MRSRIKREIFRQIFSLPPNVADERRMRGPLAEDPSPKIYFPDEVAAEASLKKIYFPDFPDEVSKFVPELVLSFVSFQMEQLHPSSFIGIQFAICYVTWPMWRIECPANIKIYIDAAVVVLIYYVSLLKINLSYIWLAIFPFMVLVFIGALCKELSHQRGSQRRDNGEARSRSIRTGTHAVILIPYWALCWIGRYGRDDSFIVSHFLLFLSSTLGALTLMMARLAPTGVAPGIAPASELLRKASLVVLLVTVHTMAAEFLGEDVVLFCLPELVPVLLWFSLHLDRGGSIISVDEIKSRKNWLTALGAVLAPAFAFLAAFMDESGLSWCRRTSVSFGVSGLLIYYVVFMLREWPGQAGTVTTTLKEAVQLLKYWANVLLIAAAVLLVFTSLFRVGLRSGGVRGGAPGAQVTKGMQNFYYLGFISVIAANLCAIYVILGHGRDGTGKYGVEGTVHIVNRPHVHLSL